MLFKVCGFEYLSTEVGMQLPFGLISGCNYSLPWYVCSQNKAMKTSNNKDLPVHVCILCTIPSLACLASLGPQVAEVGVLLAND